MTRHLALLTISFTILSCSHQNNNQEKIKATLESSLEKSTSVMRMVTDQIMMNLDNKKLDSRTWVKAGIWMPEAEWLANLVLPVQQKIKKFRALPEINGIEFNLFIKELTNIKDSVLRRSAEFNEAFAGQFFFISNFIQLAGTDTLKAGSGIKLKIPSYAYAFLENQLIQLEYAFVRFCDLKSDINDCSFTVPYITLNQNLDILQPGSLLTIRTEILNERYTMYDPVIYINNKIINRGEDRSAVYNIYVPSEPGKYRIPVNVKFIDMLNGKESEIKKWVNYSVIKPCGENNPLN